MQASDAVVLSELDKAPLTTRFWITIGILCTQFAFEFFDFFVVGYLVAVVAPQWKLTFGNTSIILMSSGVGAIVGALVFGKLADIWGRKPLIIVGTLLYSLSAGAVALIPDGSWILFAGLRFFVGLGLGAVNTSQVALIQEFTPTRYRTVIGTAANAALALGVLIAAASSASLLNLIGWRGLAAIGVTPVLLVVAVIFFVPESIRWLVANKQLPKARTHLGWLLKLPGNAIAVSEWSPAATTPKAKIAELYRDRTKFWFTIVIWLTMSTAISGVLLWGPTIVALLLKISPRQAATYFVVMSVGALIIRIPFLYVVHRYGRRVYGLIVGYVAAVSLAAAAGLLTEFVGSVPIFLILLILAYMFIDAGFGNIVPYSAEIYPVRLAARAVGVAQAMNGLGKILGPLCLAFIAGSSNVINPQATEAAAAPAFIFLAGCMLLAAIAFTVVKIEPHGKPLELRPQWEHEEEPKLTAAQ